MCPFCPHALHFICAHRETGDTGRHRTYREAQDIQGGTGHTGRHGTYREARGIGRHRAYMEAQDIQGGTGHREAQGIQGGTGHTGRHGHREAQGIQGSTGHTGRHRAYREAQDIQGGTGRTGRTWRHRTYREAQGIHGGTGHKRTATNFDGSQWFRFLWLLCFLFLLFFDLLQPSQLVLNSAEYPLTPNMAAELKSTHFLFIFFMSSRVSSSWSTNFDLTSLESFM